MRWSDLRIRRLWQGNKGRSADELELPPLIWDGAGYSFAVSKDGKELCLCNQEHLLLWTILPNNAVLNKVISPMSGAELWGITSLLQGWLVVAKKPKQLMLIYLDRRLRIIKTVTLEGFLKEYNLSPPLRIRLGTNDRIYLADSEEGVTVDDRGRTVSRWLCPFGFAVSADGRLALPPSDRVPLADMTPFLIDIDRRGLQYWQIDTPQKDHPQPYIVTSLVISDSAGVVKQQLVLNGVLSIISELRRASQIEWIEITRSGQVYVLGWTYRGLHGSVGLWRLSM